ncbi:MAG: hypothetical protein NVS9B11_15330 [Candidatus Dormibacteraceae bacterium]
MTEPPAPKRSHDPHTLAAPWIEYADRSLYVATAVLFLVAAVAMTGYALVTFVQHLGEDFPLTLVTFINDLLLVLIILEVLGTVRSYLETGTTSLKPFLYIGIISATRRILAIGAQTTLGAAPSEGGFQHLMIDLGVNGLVVLALSIALFLFGRHQPPGSSDQREPDRWG